MNRNQKRVLFYFCLGAFLILSSLVSLYALGYRYDFVNADLQKTGSLHASVSREAKVFVNGKYEGDTSVFGDSFSKNRLAPREYKLEINAEGYNTWQKTAIVREGLLTDFASVYLVKKNITPVEEDPEIVGISFINDALIVDIDDAESITDKLNINSSAIYKAEQKYGTWYVLTTNRNFYTITGDEVIKFDFNVQDFSFDNSESKIVWFTTNEVWIEWLRDTTHQPLKIRGDKEFIYRSREPIVSAQWFSTDEHILVAHGSKLELIEIDGRGGRNIFTIFQHVGIKKMIYDPDINEILVSYEKSIASLPLE